MVPADFSKTFTQGRSISASGDLTNFPASKVNTFHKVTSAGWLGGAEEVGVYVNVGDLLICINSTASGTYAEVATNWNIYRHIIYLPDGYRWVSMSSNTADLRSTKGNSYGFINSVFTVYEDGNVKSFAGGPVEIDAHTASILTVEQLSSVHMTTIHNYAQAAADIDNTLPTPAANLSALCTVATAQAANYWRFTCTGKIYLNGSSTAKNYVQLSAPAVGDYFSFFTAKIADGSYVYRVTSGIGSLTTN